MAKCARFFLVIFISLSLSLHADVLIYKGRSKQVVTGGGGKYPMTAEIHLVLDTVLQKAITITGYKNVNGGLYVASSAQDINLAPISLPNGKSSTVISWPNGHISEDAEVTSESLLATGRNVAVYTGSHTLQIPVTMQSSERHTSWDSEKNLNYYSDSNVRLVLDREDTIRANAAGETLDQAVGAIATKLQAQGWMPSI